MSETIYHPGVPETRDPLLSPLRLHRERVRLLHVGPCGQRREVRHRHLPVHDLPKAKIVTAGKLILLIEAGKLMPIIAIQFHWVCRN